jgi:hypothetical protein
MCFYNVGLLTFPPPIGLGFSKHREKKEKPNTEKVAGTPIWVL